MTLVIAHQGRDLLGVWPLDHTTLGDNDINQLSRGDIEHWIMRAHAFGTNARPAATEHLVSRTLLDWDVSAACDTEIDGLGGRSDHEAHTMIAR